MSFPPSVSASSHSMKSSTIIDKISLGNDRPFVISADVSKALLLVSNSMSELSERGVHWCSFEQRSIPHDVQCERSQVVVVEDRRPRKYLTTEYRVIVVLTPETRLGRDLDPITGGGG